MENKGIIKSIIYQRNANIRVMIAIMPFTLDQVKKGLDSYEITFI
jgi:hypothetical protein